MALSFKQSLAYFWEQIGKQFVKNGTIDWAQNDETKSGYIKNRTHYIGFEETGESFKNVHSDGLFNIANDDSISAAVPVPPGYHAYMGYVNASSKLFNESSDVTGFKIIWEGKTYYSKILNEFENQQIMFGNVDIFISILEHIQGTTLPPEMRNEVPELAMHNMPFFGVLGYDPIDGVFIQLFANKNFGEWVPIKVDILTGDGEIEKLNNIYLDENVVITNSEQSNIIAGPFLVPMDDPDASEPGYLLLNPPITGFENNKTYYITINNETFCSIPSRVEQEGQIAYFFGNFTGMDDAPEGIYNSPEANYYGAYMLSDDWNMLTIIPRDGVEITNSLTVTIAEGIPDNAWLARDKNGNIYWEEKTHGIIKDDAQEIVPVREYTLEELEGLLLTQWPQLQEGARYSITFGTATWETVCSTLSSDGIQAHILGDIYGIMNGQDGMVSDPPIVIIQLPVAIDEGLYNLIEFDPDFNVGDVLYGESVYFGITKCDSIKKLDSKYIDWPDTIPVLSEKDGNVYLEIDNLEGTLDDFYNAYVYSIEGLENVSWEEGCYYTVKTDNNAALLQCMRYSGDLDAPGCWMLMDPFFGTVDGYAFKLYMNALKMGSCVVLYTDNTGVLLSKNTITSLTIQDKQTYLNKINKYAIPDRLPLMPGSGSDSLQTSNYDSKAYGVESIALRRGSQAGGDGSLAIGAGGFYGTTRADGNFSIAINDGKAQGDSSIACARGTTTANALYALAYGENAVAGSNYQIVLGSHNILDDSNTYGFIFGNGDGYAASANCKCNAFTINWNGNVWAKNLYMGGTSDAEGASKVATETFVNNKLTNILTKSDLIYTTNEDKNLFAGPSGAFNKNFDLGSYSFTWGPLALGQGYASTAIGSSATVYESDFSTAIGYKATVYDGADYSVAIGSEAAVSYNADHSFAIGHGTAANSSEQIALGKYNRPLTGYSLMLGNGSGAATASRSNAFAVTTAGTGYFAGDLYVNGNGATNAFTGAKKVATESYVDTKVAGLVDSAPGTLDTLNELAAALGDDPNFATTVATEIGKKADKTDLVALTEAEILEVCGVAAVAHVSEVTW